MKIALAQQNYHIGNFEENTRKIIEAIRQAKTAGAWSLRTSSRNVILIWTA